jgi:import receptor subunit TOM22
VVQKPPQWWPTTNDDRIGKTPARPSFPPDDEHLQNFGLPPLPNPTTTYLNAPHKPLSPQLASNRVPLNTTAKMVKLEEVMDEEFVREQDGPHDEDDWDTDSGTQSTQQHATALSNSLSPNSQPKFRTNTQNVESDTSSIASAPVDETLYERILALQDMIPASTRRSVSSKVSTTTSWLKSGLFMGGKTLWVVSTSALLLGVPWALAYSEEQMIVEQERAEMMAQRAQNEVCLT